jgi:hypothetical protein
MFIRTGAPVHPGLIDTLFGFGWLRRSQSISVDLSILVYWSEYISFGWNEWEMSLSLSWIRRINKNPKIHFRVSLDPSTFLLSNRREMSFPFSQLPLLQTHEHSFIEPKRRLSLLKIEIPFADPKRDSLFHIHRINLILKSYTSTL